MQTYSGGSGYNRIDQDDQKKYQAGTDSTKLGGRGRFYKKKFRLEFSAEFQFNNYHFGRKFI
jgi:hypothetical protein